MIDAIFEFFLGFLKEAIFWTPAWLLLGYIVLHERDLKRQKRQRQERQRRENVAGMEQPDGQEE